jgi:hypothetical protein
VGDACPLFCCYWWRTGNTLAWMDRLWQRIPLTSVEHVAAVVLLATSYLRAAAVYAPSQRVSSERHSVTSTGKRKAPELDGGDEGDEGGGTRVRVAKGAVAAGCEDAVTYDDVEAYVPRELMQMLSWLGRELAEAEAAAAAAAAAAEEEEEGKRDGERDGKTREKTPQVMAVLQTSNRLIQVTSMRELHDIRRALEGEGSESSL